MQLKKLQEYISQYKRQLERQPDERNLYKWESLRIFQENWDIDAPDFAAMYNRSLQNSQTRRLWSRENFAPKEMLLKFIAMQPDFVRSMFRDLFNEEKEVENRVDRFVFYCDELLKEYKEQYPRSIENNHYHGNYGLISLYLAFQYPELYAPYDFHLFQQVLLKLSAKNIPPTHDVGRHFKVMRTIYQFLMKEEGLLEIHQQRLHPTQHYQQPTLLLVDDFCHFLKGQD